MSTTAVLVLLWAAAFVAGVPILVLFVEVLASLGKPAPIALPARSGTLTVLIPAHDEERDIGRTVSDLLPQLQAGDRLVVIADNCTDQTAARAKEAGAVVCERNDSSRRGKGAALRFGLERLAENPPDVVLFVDAETQVAPGAVDTLHRWAMSLRKPVQAVYLLHSAHEAGMRSQVSALAFGVKNLVRPRGLRRLGLACPLLGTGMAVPWAMLDRGRLSEESIVEDLQMGIDLAVHGHPPLLCEDASVTGWLPLGEAAARVQRRRWEHGHLRTLLSQVPRLAALSILRAKPILLAMALDLAVPPLSFLCLLWAGWFAATAVAAWHGYGKVPFFAASVSGGLLALSVVVAWAGHLRKQIPFRALMFVPFYVAWKIPLYLGFFVRSEKSWVRTPREEAGASASDGPRDLN